MAKLNRNVLQILFKRGTRSQVELAAAAYMGIEGEPAYTTDDKHLWMRDSAVFRPVQTLDMAVCDSDAVICNNDEIVFNV